MHETQKQNVRTEMKQYVGFEIFRTKKTKDFPSNDNRIKKTKIFRQMTTG